MAQHPARTTANTPAEHVADHDTVIKPVHNLLEAAVLAAVNGQVIKRGASVFEAANVAALSNATPLADGTATSGSGVEAARQDHVHPAATSATGGPYYSIFVPGSGEAALTETALGKAEGATGFAVDNGRLLVAPVTFTRAVALGLGVNVLTAGSAGSLLRLGIWNDTNGRPSTLMLDAGTVDSATTGVKFGTGTFTPNVGSIYWVGCAPQGAAATGPQYQITNPVHALPGVAGSDGYGFRYTQTGAFGTLAATAPTTADGTVPRMRFRL